MLYFVVTASFKHIDKAHQVRTDIGLGILQGITHTGLGGKIHHALGPMIAECRGDGIGIFEIMLQVGETPVAGQLFKPSLFQADIIVVIEVVDAHHFVAALQ